MLRSVAALSLGLVLGAAPAVAQPAPTPAEPEIVVRAQTEAEVARFIAALTETVPGHQIARWNDHICPKVLGLDQAHSAFVAGRIAAVARDFRIPVAPGRCRGNIVVVVTVDPDGFVEAIIRNHPRLFRGPNGNFASPRELAELRAARPVRWIAASRTGNAEGRPLLDGHYLVSSASRITGASREDARFSFIIVDARQLTELSWGQLADYLAMVALARPAMEAEFDTATILSVFRLRDQGARGPSRLTRRDRAFLTALYRSDPSVSANRQRGSIRERMEGAAAAGE